MALWGGRFQKETDQQVKAFSSSIDIDSRLWAVDLKVSIAHARMLGQQGILTMTDAEKIIAGLKGIGDEIAAGQWSFDPAAEDIHGEIERRLFEKIGEPAKKLHTARSRNDQVATDTRLFLKENVSLILQDLFELQSILLEQSKEHVETILPGMTHLQHAQPVSLAHHLMAYFWMFQRDAERFEQSIPRILSLTLGSAALAGTGFPVDRQMTARELGFASVAPNSLDAVSDRDFVLEFLSHAAITNTHLSRLCEELIMWSSPAYGFVELGDEVTTGSSIMPQKKNPDVAELIRGRSGRTNAALIGALTMMKALPLSYNRDMQEDKVHLFMGMDTVRECVRLTSVMLKNLQWNAKKMASSLSGDFSNATDLADDLVAKGLSFREAHEVVGRLVQWCIAHDKSLESLTVSELQSHHQLFESDSHQKLSHMAVMNARTSEGGTAPVAVRQQLQEATKVLQQRMSKRDL